MERGATPDKKRNRRKESSIPLFICLSFIRALLEIAEQDFSYESVFRYLRSGLSGMEPEEVDLLENYVLALGVRGAKRWEERFIRDLWILCMEISLEYA